MSIPIQPPRTYLFVPGSRPERFAKALAAGADAVVLDLEDAVAIGDKETARASVCEWIGSATTAECARTVVRINDIHSNWFSADLRALAAVGQTLVMLPKAESPLHIAELLAKLPGAQVLALIETARGVAEVDPIAASLGVSRLVFGTLDFALDLALETERDAVGLVYAASRIAIASRLAGLAAPVAGVTPQIDDESRLLADWAAARCHGFGAKLCIHPKQVAPIHQALLPSAEALDWAKRVLAAEAASPGAAQLDGRMVDKPVVLQAQRILSLGAR